MSSAFDGEDFISFDAAPSAGSTARAADGAGAGSKESSSGSASGSTRNRIVSMVAQAAARRAAEASADGAAKAAPSAMATPDEGETSQGDAEGAQTTAGPSTVPKTAGLKRKYHELSAEEKKLSKKERKELYAASTPWSTEVDWDRCRNAAEMLHREIMAFDDWLTPTTAEVECREMVIALIRKAIKSKWSDADVRPFGSHNTRLYLPEGDIDLVVLSTLMSTQPREVVLRNMAYIFRVNNLTTGHVQVIARAKVPIVKFECSYGNYKVDISVNQGNGLEAAKFVSDHLKEQPALRPLIMIIKQLLSSRNLSEVYVGGLGSYSVILTAISFMQMHPRIQRCEIDPASNLGVLLLEYLELFGRRFGYDDLGISVRGRGSYFRKESRGFYAQRGGGLRICIEDPLDVSNDVSAGSYNFSSVRSVLSGAFELLTSALGERTLQIGGSKGYRMSADQIRSAAKRRDTSSGQYSDDEDEWARQMLMQELDQAGAKDPMSFLGKLFGIKPSTVKHRKKIKRLWESNELQAKLGRPSARITPEPGPSHSRVDRSSSSSGVIAITESQRSRSAATATTSTGRADQERPTRSEAMGNTMPSLNRAIASSIKAGSQSKNAGSQGAVDGRLQDSVELVLSESEDDADGDEGESRYATARRNAAPIFDSNLGQTVDNAYVLDDSASSAGESVDHEYAEAADALYAKQDPRSGTKAALREDEEDIQAPARKRARGSKNGSLQASASASPTKRRATRREVDDYWASKGNASSTPKRQDDDDDDDVVFVGTSASQS